MVAVIISVVYKMLHPIHCKLNDSVIANKDILRIRELIIASNWEFPLGEAAILPILRDDLMVITML